MTGQQWLVMNYKKPFTFNGYWYWGSELDRDLGDPNSDDMLLPEKYFSEMIGSITFPNCRMYFSEQEAINDFLLAFQKVYREV